MKGIKRFLGIGALALLASVAVPKEAHSEGWKTNLNNTLATKYVSNGILKGNHVVTRPSIKFENEFDNESSIAFSALANIDFHEEEMTKLDFGLNYSFLVGDDAAFETGYTRKMSKVGYGRKDTDVLLGRFTVDAPYQPSLEMEFNVHEGSYFGLSVQKPIHVLSSSGYGRTLTAGAEIGYNVHAFRKDAGFSHFETSLKIPLTMPRSGFLSKLNGDINVRYSVPLADDIKEHWIVEFNISKKL